MLIKKTLELLFPITYNKNLLALPRLFYREVSTERSGLTSCSQNICKRSLHGDWAQTPQSSEMTVKIWPPKSMEESLLLFIWESNSRTIRPCSVGSSVIKVTLKPCKSNLSYLYSGLVFP